MKEQSQELKQVRAEFDVWRENKIGKEPVPEYLWNKATNLLKTYSTSQVSKYLGLDYNYLKRLGSTTKVENQYQSKVDEQDCSYVEQVRPVSVTKGSKTSTSITTPAFLEISAKEISKPAFNFPQQVEEKTQSIFQEVKEAEPKVQPSCQLVFESKDGVKLSMSLPLDWINLSLFCSNLLK
jgi:hypothetical protein